MAKTIEISEKGLGSSLSIGREVIKLDESQSIENAEKVASQFPQYITIKDDSDVKQTPATRPIKIAENAVSSEPK